MPGFFFYSKYNLYNWTLTDAIFIQLFIASCILRFQLLLRVVLVTSLVTVLWFDSMVLSMLGPFQGAREIE